MCACLLTYGQVMRVVAQHYLVWHQLATAVLVQGVLHAIMCCLHSPYL